MTGQAMTVPAPGAYLAPRTLAEAAQALRAGGVTILAGGTDLMPQTQAGRIRFRPVLMNIRHVPELRGLVERADLIHIGALTTITELLQSPVVRTRLPLLYQSCEHFASDQIRNAATLGGNVCNASPAGDTLIALLAHDARVVLVSKPDGSPVERRLALQEFLLGPGKTALGATELLTAVELTAAPAGFAGEFFKFGTRPGLDISTISIALGGVRDGSALRRVRVALGAVAPTPVRAPDIEAVLEGRVLDDAAVDAAVAAARNDVHPITDVRASDWYRRELVGNMLRRILDHVRKH
jgi:CO/xanthine dehydrogenase FAD-binding subunit